jgi:DNA polymerase-3 subunit delta
LQIEIIESATALEVKGRQVEAFVKAPPPGLRLALFYGPDQGLSRERADAIARHVCADLTDPFRVADLAASDVKSDPARLGDEAAAISMLGGRRVVRIRDADHATSKVVEAFLEDPPGDALVVVEAGDIGKGALTRAVESAGAEAAVIACYPDEGEDLRSLIVATLKAEGLMVSADALGDLTARLGDDRRMTRGELAKLALFKGPDGARKGQVTREDVEAALGVEAEADLGEIADACGGGDIEALDDCYARAIAGGETAPGILRTVMMHMQKLHLAAALVDEGLEPERAADKAFPRLLWKRKGAIQRQIRAWSPDTAMRAIEQLADAEILTRRTEIPADAVTGRALLLIAAQARRAGRQRV